jgi:hypothetical protein
LPFEAIERRVENATAEQMEAIAAKLCTALPPQ